MNPYMSLGAASRNNQLENDRLTDTSTHTQTHTYEGRITETNCLQRADDLTACPKIHIY